jgi:hypothetical protein
LGICFSPRAFYSVLLNQKLLFKKAGSKWEFRNNGKISIIFPLNQGDLDGILDVYVFAEEKQSNGLPEICGTGHSINPPNENWYYCTAAERQIHE